MKAGVGMRDSGDIIRRVEDKRLEKVLAPKSMKRVPPMEYDGADSLDADGGVMFTTSEILDLMSGTDTFH